MSKFNRQKLIHLLSKYPEVEIEFIKKDGSTRKMKATRNHQVLFERVGPVPMGESHKSEIDAKHGNITVFDLEKDGFRSFNVDRLKKLVVR